MKLVFVTKQPSCKRIKVAKKAFIYQKLSRLSVFRLIMLSLDVPKTSRDYLYVLEFIFSNRTFKNRL